MGSGNSKGVVRVVEESSSSSSSSGRDCSASRSFGRRVFGSACFGLPRVLSDEKDDEQKGRSKEDSVDSCKEEENNANDHLKFAQSEARPLSSGNYGSDEGNQENALDANLDFGSISATQETPIANAPSRSRSRFGFLPDGFGFGLGSAASLGSSNGSVVYSRSLSVPPTVGDQRTESVNNHSPDNRNRLYQHSLIDAISAQDVEMHSLAPNSIARRVNRRSQESTEGTARFSRTLSVGRLRERVLRQTSLLDERFDSNSRESDRGSSGLGYISRTRGRRYLNGLSSIYSTMTDEVSSISGSSNSTNLNRRNDNVNVNVNVVPESRESGTEDSLVHRSAFLERRRRIRTQVRALQRLGSHFENLSVHERSCILSGQHRAGNCTCRANARSANHGDTSTRASISRIVMLAEALFEVLDEIHQQAVVLASRPSISSIGSIPAPKAVVDSMPVRTYTRMQKQHNDEDAQCYICLVEYEDGDCMRVLPCQHEFHQTCVDKWLKEIHRVCPLCRGDVCVSDASSVGKL